MAFKEGENLVGKGKFYPVFISHDGDMYSVRMSEEQLEMFQTMLYELVSTGRTVLIYSEPLNNACTYRITDNRKTK